MTPGRALGIALWGVGWLGLLRGVAAHFPHSRALRGTTPRERSAAFLLISLLLVPWPVTMPLLLIGSWFYDE